jgi:hypothetical protein
VYWLLELPWGRAGMVNVLAQNLPESAGDQLTKSQILTTEPDLSYLARTVYDDTEIAFFPAEFTAEDVILGRMSIDTIKNIRHYILLADKYEITGKVVKVTPKYFKIAGVLGLQTIITTSFRLGSPTDE